MIDSKLLKQKEELTQSKEIHFLDVENNYRFERKFTIPIHRSVKSLVRIIKENRTFFREVFQQRKINNIYFDTVGYNDYFDNVLGVSDRKKIRIRWYGEMFGKIEKPILEIKIKKGLVGDKWSYKLKPFILDNNFLSDDIQKVFLISNLPLPILESLKMVFPSLLNSYQRRYFLSADKKFRATLDFELQYHKIENRFNNFNLKPSLDPNKIVELKYKLEHDNLANKVTTQFPFRLNKNSKYVNGINTIKQFPQ